MMWFKTWILTAIAFQLTSAVFTDEAFKIDWAVESLGNITSVQYDNDIAITVSSQFICGLNRQSGDLIWRKPARYQITGLTRINRINESKYVVGDGPYISLFDRDGALINEFLVPSKTEISGLTSSNGKQTVFIALQDQSIYKFDTLLSDGSFLPSLPAGNIVGNIDSGFVIDKDGSLYTVQVNSETVEKPVFIGKGEFLYSLDKWVIWSDSNSNIMINDQKTVLKKTASLTLDLDNHALVEFSSDSDDVLTWSFDQGLITNKETTSDKELDLLAIGSDVIRFADQPDDRLGRDQLDVADVLFLEQDEEQVQNEILFEENANILTGFISRVKRHLSERPSFMSWSSTTDVDRLFANKVIVFVSKNDILRATDIDGNILWEIDSLEGPFRTGLDNRIHTKTHIIDAEGHYEPQIATQELKYDFGYDDSSVFGIYGRPTWEFSLDGYKLAAIAERQPDDVSASIGIILPDRRVLYKYLHRGSIAAAFINSNGDARVVLLDKVTGRVLGEKVHDHVHDKTLRLVYGEYWISYTFDSDFGPQIVLWDLLESKLPNVRTFNEDSYSSFDSFPSPDINSRAMFLPESVSALGISKTRFGITSRDILIGFNNGQIVALPKNVLDNSNDNILQVDPYHVITHNRHVLVTGIKTSGTLLESTSVVVGYGKDVFVTRITPSQPFDMLTASFSKQGLINTMMILVSGVLILRPIVKKRALNMNWQ